MPVPKDQTDAKEKLKCHKDAIDDFQSQIEIIDLEIETLKEDSGDTLPYLVDEDVNLKKTESINCYKVRDIIATQPRLILTI